MMVDFVESEKSGLEDTPLQLTTHKRLENVTKSPADKREYRAIELANEMTVILVSDPETKKSAAALNVLVGSLSAPKELPGLPHFLEHMVFLGTEKYPVENDYQKYLTEHGGDHNASTGNDFTQFHFECSNDSLEGAIDRFSQFFISPLFSEDCQEREVLAVNSEHENNVPDDDRRSYRLERFLSKEGHPYTKFTTGNKSTLSTLPKKNGIDVRAELLKFHDQFYSANIMKLAVFGLQSLDQLEEMVVKYFSPVKNKRVELPYWPESPMGCDQRQTRIDILPLMDIMQLKINFAIPDCTKFYKTGATSQLIQLLFDEGPNSLSAFLKKKKKFVTSLYPCVECPARGFAFFYIQFFLTPLGTQHIDEIIFHTFQYLKLFQSLGPQKWIWEEMKLILEIRFRFTEDQDAVDVVTELVDNMADYPIEDVLTAGKIITEFDPQLISTLMECLVPENVRITTELKANEGKVDQTEEYFGTRYCYTKIPPDVIQTWTNCELNPDLQILSSSKEFIPTKFDLKPRDEQTPASGSITPRIILDKEMSRVWYLQDTEFLLPRAIMGVDILTIPHWNTCSKSYNLRHLYVKLLTDVLREKTDNALRAGLVFTIYSSEKGLWISVSGHDDKLANFFNYILKFVLNFPTFSASTGGADSNWLIDQFNEIKEEYIRGLKNWKISQPSEQARDYLQYFLDSEGFTWEELLETVQDLTYDQLLNYVQSLWSEIRLQWLFYGNLTEMEALSIHNEAFQHFAQLDCQLLPVSKLEMIREARLPSGCRYIYKMDHEQHSNSCVHLLLQLTMESVKQSVILELILQIMEEPCFTILRTKEQLGYYVGCSGRLSRGVLAFQIIVQGDKHPEYLESRINNFLLLMEETMENLTLEKFTKFKEAVRVDLSEKPKTLGERGGILMSEIFYKETFNFDKQTMELGQLEEISMEEVQEFFKQWLSPKATERKVLSIHVTGLAAKTVKDKIDEEVEAAVEMAATFDDRELVVDIKEWKSRMKIEYFPPAQAYGHIPPWKE